MQSSLANRVPANPTSEQELDALRRRAWQEQGCIVIKPEEIANEWARQAVVNEMNKKYGRRMVRLRGRG